MPNQQSQNSPQKKKSEISTNTSPKNAQGKRESKVHKRQPFRDVNKDGVTYSFLQQFAFCREQARLGFVEGLTQDGTIDALDFGSAFHDLLEYLAEDSSSSRLTNHKMLKDRLNRWLAGEREQRQLKKADADHIGFLCDQCVMMFPLYVDYWRKRNGHEFKSDFVCQEADFRVPHFINLGPKAAEAYEGLKNDPTEFAKKSLKLIHNVHGEPRQIILRGRFDAIFRLQGKLWLMENKTKSQIDEEGLQQSLSQDLQSMMYCHAIKLQYGEYPAGILYNVIRRPMHRMTKADKTPSDLIRRMEADIRQDPDKYFMRWTISLDSGDIEKWVERTLNPLLTQVCLWWDEISVRPFDPWSIPGRIHHFQNPEGLWTRYGKSSYFNYLTRGTTHGLRRRTK